MQDRRNHWKEASLPQNRFLGPESLTSYPVDQNELSLMSEQERVILLPTPYASPSAYSTSSFGWESAENQTVLDHNNGRRYTPSIDGSFHNDSSDIGWTTKNLSMPHRPSQPEPFSHQYEHGVSVQDHAVYDPRQGQEVLEHPSLCWTKRSPFENTNQNCDRPRYDRNENSGIHLHSEVKQQAYGSFWNGACAPSTHDDSIRYQNNRQVERGPEERFAYTEAKGNAVVEDIDFSAHSRCAHLNTHVNEHNSLTLPLQQDHLEHVGNHMRFPVPLFPDRHHGSDPQSVSKPVPLHHSSQFDHAAAYGMRISQHYPEDQYNADNCTTKLSADSQLETSMLKSHSEAWVASKNRMPFQTTPPVVEHVPLQADAQFWPPFKRSSLQIAGPDAMENFPLQQLPTKPEFSQLDSRAAVVAVRSVAAPLDIEEGELVDSDDEGALVIDESEDHEIGKASVKKKPDELQSGQSQPVGAGNKSVSLNISQRIESEIQQAKEASSKTEKKGINSVPHTRNCQTQEGGSAKIAEEPGLYPMGEPEHMAKELLKQPDFVRQLCMRTEQKFSSFSLLWQAVGQVKNIIDTASDQNSIKAFQAYVADKLPKCCLNSQPFSSDFNNQGLLYRKEIEFFDIHYHGNVALWKKNVLQYYRRIVQYPRFALQNRTHPAKSFSSNVHTPLVSSQNVGSEQVDHPRGTVLLEKQRQDHCAPKHSYEPSERTTEYHDCFRGSSPPPSHIIPQRGEEGSANVTLAIAVEPTLPLSQSSGMVEAQWNNQSTCLQQDGIVREDQICDGQGNRVEYTYNDVCEPSLNEGIHCSSEVVHRMGRSFEQCDDVGSHQEVTAVSCDHDSFAVAQDTRLQDLHNFGYQHSELLQNYLPRGDYQHHDDHQAAQASSSHLNQTESVQTEEQYSPGQYSSFCPPPTQPALGCGLPPHVDPGLHHQQRSTYYPSSDAFMPLHVTSNPSGTIADRTVSENRDIQVHGHHNNQPQWPPVYGGGHREDDYRGRNLNTRRDPSESCGYSAPGDQPYDPALPLMDLTSFQEGSRCRTHSLLHGNIVPSPYHISSPSRAHRDPKDRTHFKAPYPPWGSGIQVVLAHSDVGGVDMESSHSGRKPQHDAGSKHVAGEYSRSSEGKDHGYIPLGYKRKQRSKCQPRLSKKQRRRLRCRQSRDIEAFTPHSSMYNSGANVPRERKSSGSFGKKGSGVGPKQRKRQYTATKNDYSDEDLEVLELRKEVIMSIVSNNAEKAQAMKRARVTHEPVGGDGVELQGRRDVPSVHDDKRPSDALQPSTALAEERHVAEVAVTCLKADTVQTVEGMQQPQNDVVVEILSAHTPSTTVSNTESSLRSTPGYVKVDDSPVPSPLVAMLKKNEKGSKSRSASPLQKPKPTAIKVVPRDSQTHKVQEFSIQISNASDTSESEVDSDEPPLLTAQGSSSGMPTSEDINQLVKLLRKDSENEQRVQTLQQTGTLKLLPPGQQQEYNELKMRLALYKRRKGKGLQMSTKAMAKVPHLLLKRGSAPAVLVSKQQEANKLTPMPRAADVSGIKNRIEMCNNLIKNHRSSIDNELLAQDELKIQQAVCEQELDESTLRVELLEKKLKDAREEHRKYEIALSELRSKVATSEEVVAKQTSYIKEKDNEVRLLQRKLKMMSQQQLDSPQLVDNCILELPLTGPVAKPVSNGAADSVLEQECVQDKAALSTHLDYEVVSPSYPQYECVSDAEETCGTSSALRVAATDSQQTLDDVDMKEHAFSPLETEMVSDTETVESTSAQNADTGCIVSSVPNIVVEMVSDSEDVAGQLGKDTKSADRQVIEQVSDTEEWCLVFSGEDSGLNSVATSSDIGQSTLVVTKPDVNLETTCLSSGDVHSKGLSPLQSDLSLSSPINCDVPEPVTMHLTASLEANKPPNLSSSNSVLGPVSKNRLTTTNPKAGSVSTKVHVKAPVKVRQHLSVASKQKLPSQTLPYSAHQKIKQLPVVPSFVAQKVVWPAKNVIKTTLPAATVQLKTGLPSQSSNKLVTAKSLSAHNALALQKMRLSALPTVNQKSKASPKRLVHSKVTELHGRLQKELLALEALKTARRVKSSLNAKRTGDLQGVQTGVPSPTTSAVTGIGTNNHAEVSDQLKQAIKFLGIQMPTNVAEVLTALNKPDLNALLSSPQAATFRMPLVSCDSLQLTGSSRIVARFVPEHVVLAAEKLERQQHRGGDTKDRVLPASSCTGYTSPLLSFHSYRLSPHFLKFASLTSLTYSNKIDPFKMMCRFELLGCCNDSDCPAQHFKDIKLSKEEVAKDLVSYCPALAGCSDDVSFIDDSLPESQQQISTKVDLYAKSLCDSFSAKLSDEQLCLYIAHKVTLGRREVTGSSGIDLDERAWYSKSGTNQQTKSLKEARPLSDMVSEDASKNLGWDVGLDNSSGLQRYYTIESSVLDSSSPCDPSGWVKKAQKVAQTGSLSDACGVLKQGLLSFPASEEIWVHLLQAVRACKDLSSELQDSAQTEGLWSKALQTCPTYSVIFECVRQASTYDAKRNLIVDGYKMLSSKNYSTVEERSHICLELLLNAVLLEQMFGAHEQAIKIMQHALLAPSDQPTCSSTWADIRSNLTREDLVFAVLCFGHYLCHTCLPLTIVFGFDGACPPVRIVNKEPFLIPLNPEVICGSEKHEQIVQLFRASLIEFVTQDPLTGSSRVCNVLCQNLVQLEAACGNIKKVQTLLVELLNVLPSSDGFWLLLAKLNEQESTQKCIDTISDAVTHCPRSPDVYCCAANILLAAGQTSEAIGWLKGCVEQFYEIPEGMEVSVSDAVLLYRKLLGQLVPYQYDFPPSSSFVDIKQLGLNLVSLWKCYILLTKLSQSEASTEYYHSSVEDAFESAVHCVHDQLRLKLLWREYLIHLKLQVLDNPTVHNFKVFSDCVERCIEAVKYQGTFPYHLVGQPSEFRDYSFHNEVLGLFLDCSLVNSNSRLFYVTKYLKLLPRNPMCVSRLVQCALNQSPEEVELAQVVLANYLAEDPSFYLLWKMAISLELRLGHTREARWMYRQATVVLPLQADLWKEFLLFELNELQHSRSSPSVIRWLVERCNQVGLDLIPIAKQAILLS